VSSVGSFFYINDAWSHEPEATLSLLSHTPRDMEELKTVTQQVKLHMVNTKLEMRH